MAVPGVGPNDDKGFDKEEVNELLQDAITAYETRACDEVQEGNFGILDTSDPNSDGYWVVEWKGTPYPLQEPTKVEGCGDDPMEEGTMVCEAEGWYSVPRTAHRWYQKLPQGETKLYWMQHVLEANVALDDKSPCILQWGFG